MKLLKYAFLISLLLFAWSVCVCMLNLTTDEEATIMGIPNNYFFVPLLMCNIAIVAINGFQHPHGGISSIILTWMILVSFVTAVNATNIVFDLIKVNLWPTTYFASYLLCKKDPLFFKKIIYTFFVIFILGTVYFITGKEIQGAMSNMGLMTSSNSVFCVITVLPFILLFKNKGVSIAAIIATFLCVIFSNKRSVTIAFAIALMPTLNNLFSGIKSKGRRTFVVILLCIVAIVSFYYMGNTYLGGRIFDRFQGIEDDGGSGRVEIWAYVLKAFNSSDLLSQLFGHGHYAVSKLGDASAAHNDFLQVLYDYGIVVLFVYLSLHTTIIKKALMLKRTKSPQFASFFFFTVIFIVMSWVSILIPQQRYIIYMAILMAYTEVETSKNNIE
ncbi:MAG: O-antigen ligase family protein [Bacteroidales bacterium]|nr:O-antigen ligase family protein [Bacteroidales bacterium]